MALFNALLVPDQQIWIAGVAITPVSASVHTPDDFTGTITYTAAGLPNGISMNSSGVFSGTPVLPATADSIVVTATDANGEFESHGFEYIIVSDIADAVNVDNGPVWDVRGGCISVTGIPATPTLAQMFAAATATQQEFYPIA